MLPGQYADEGDTAKRHRDGTGDSHGPTHADDTSRRRRSSRHRRSDDKDDTKVKKEIQNKKINTSGDANDQLPGLTPKSMHGVKRPAVTLHPTSKADISLR